MELALRPSPVYDPPASRPVRLMLAVLPPGDANLEDPTSILEGLVLQQGGPHEVLAAFHALTDGMALTADHFGRKVTLRVVKDDAADPDMFGLSPRETEVLRGMVEGLSYKMVAGRLGISFETVRTHVKKIYHKLDVCNCTEAVAKALKSGLMN